MDHITVSGQVVPVPSNWSDADIQSFAAGIKGGTDHITVGGKAYPVPASWSDKSINDYANAIKSTPAQAPAPKSEDTGVLSYIKNSLNKTAQNMNVENVLKTVDDIGESIRNGTFSLKDTVNKLDPSTDAIFNDAKAKIAKKDYSGATADVLPLAFAVDPQALVRDAAGSIPSAQTLNRLSTNGKAVATATGNLVKTTAGDLGAAAVANAIPVVGHGVSLGLAAKALVKSVKNGSAAEVGAALKNFVTMAETPEEVTAAVKAKTDARGANASYKSFPDVQAEQAVTVEPIASDLASGRTPGSIANQTPMVSPEVVQAANYANSTQRGANAAWRAIPDAPAPVAPAVQAATPAQLPSGRVPGKISTNATLPRTVTPASSTNPYGVTAAEAVPNLSKDATQALVDAHKAGELAKLPAQTKVELTQAVKNGDSAKVNEIVDEHSGDARRTEHGKNKTDVIVDYVKAHNIDISQYTTAGDRQVLANNAYAHGLENGMAVPVKTGKYRGISDESWGHIQRKLNGN